jgi:glyoxylase-like metal-dependent hydrolase (beta-lactamase superfamily II)
MKKLLLLLLVAGCAGVEQRPASVERMFVIDCGENHVKDLSRWTPGVHFGEPAVFSNHCYLIRHAKGLMLWDTGNPDRLAALPNGLTAPYMQVAEYDAVFGPEPQKYNFIATNFEKLRGAKVVKLNGDHDVFGDGSVVIKSTPGHTIGHQSLFVRLPKTGPVLLSGDMTHLMENWQAKRSPWFNFDLVQSTRSMNEMEQFMALTGARLWINHDHAQNAALLKAPAFIE